MVDAIDVTVAPIPNLAAANVQEALEVLKPDTISAPVAMKANIIDFDALRGSDDTQDAWAVLKTLLEQPSPERTALIRGARLFFRGGRAYRALTRQLITLPRYLHMEMEPSAFIDFTSVSGTFADNLFSYFGRYGYPARPINTDYLAGTGSISFSSGRVAAQGWRVGDRLLIRATEGLSDIQIGAWTDQTEGTPPPATSSFFTPGLSLSVGDGIISVADGRSYRCTVAHTTGATINLANFALCGYRATGEDVYIAGITGDTIYLTAPLRYNYPQAASPILTKIEDMGEHRFTGISMIGNHPDDTIDRGAWASGTGYSVNDTVYAPSAIGGSNRYWRCVSTHTSTTFSADRTAGRWLNLGADRAINIALSDRLTIEGGSISKMSDYAIVSSGVARLCIRDMQGFGVNKRISAGGFLSISGGYNEALIANVTIHSGGQAFMTTELGQAPYGISYGTTWQGCRAKGGAGGFSQHWLEDGATYINCEHDGALVVSGGASFDIRTPSRVMNCRSINHPVRAIMLRHHALGFGRQDAGSRGTTIDGFEAYNCLSGIQYDNQMFYYEPTPGGYPQGNLEIRNSKFQRIGGSGTQGGINLVWTQPTTGGGSSYPLLGSVTINNVFVEMTSNQHAVHIAGRWQQPTIKNLTVAAAPGFTPSGAFRPLVMTNGSVPGGENRPINPKLEQSLLRVDGAFAPSSLDGALSNAGLTSVASAGTVSIDASRKAFSVTGTTTISFVSSVSAMVGKVIYLVFAGSLTVRNNNGGNGAVVLKSGSDLSVTAGTTLSLLSDGTKWREI